MYDHNYTVMSHINRAVALAQIVERLLQLQGGLPGAHS